MRVRGGPNELSRPCALGAGRPEPAALRFVFVILFSRRCEATPPVRFRDESHHESRAR